MTDTYPDVGTLAAPGRPPATIDFGGRWRCPDDHEWEDLLNDQYGPAAASSLPSVFPHATGILWTAQARLGGTVEMLHRDEPLPPGAVS